MRKLVAAIALLSALLAPSGAAAVSPGANGRIAYATQPSQGSSGYAQRGLYTINPDGSDPRLIDVNGHNPAWSPDGSMLVYSHRESPSSCTTALYIANADGSGRRKLVDSSTAGCDVPAPSQGPLLARPAWSAAGLIAFERRFKEARQGPDGGTVDVVVDELSLIQPNGAGRRPVFNADARAAGWRAGEDPDWSPDGSRLVFHGSVEFRGQPDHPGPGLHVATLNGTAPARISPVDKEISDLAPSWSPDGGKIMFSRSQNSASPGATPPPPVRTWTMNPDGSGAAAIPDRPLGGAWAPDGRSMLWLQSGGTSSLMVGPLTGGQPSCVVRIVRPALEVAWQPGSAPAAPPGRACPTPTAPATSRADSMRGTPGADELCGLAGGDLIQGLAGNDVLWGDACKDDGVPPTGATLSTGASDRLIGGDGDDRLYGAGGKDRLEGGGGDDVLSGGPGKNRLSGGSGDDRLLGGPKKNRLDGGAGNDRLDARNGRRDFVVSCGPGRDTALVDAADQTRGCERVRRART